MKKTLINSIDNRIKEFIPINYLLATELNNKEKEKIYFIKNEKNRIEKIGTNIKNFHGYNKPIVKYKLI